MVGTRLREVEAPGHGPASPWGLVGTRLSRPAPLRGSVLRNDLIARLRAASEPLISITAPGGYGKTTLVAQWTDNDPRPSAWLSIREDCNDPTVLMRYLSAALAPVVEVPAGAMEELQAVQPRIDSVVVGTLGAALADVPPNPSSSCSTTCTC